MKRLSGLKFPIFLAATLFGGLSVSGYSGTETLDLQTYKTHSRLVLRIDEGVPAQWTEIPNGFELFFKGIGFGDLGAPLGDEDQWKAQFENLSDARLADLKLVEVAGGMKLRGHWKFPTGPNAPAHPVMEKFDFHEKTPSQYVVDFWVKEGPTVADMVVSKAVAKSRIERKRVQVVEEKKASRRIASEKKKSKITELTQFCDKPLSESRDIFLKFFPVHEKVDFGQWFNVATPDSGYTYFRPKAGSEDGGYVKLALDLYAEGKPALAIRTLDFFDKSFPTSQYRDEMRFLRANCMIKLGLHEEADKVLTDLMTDFKSKPEALLAAEYRVTGMLERGQQIAALEAFMWLVGHYSDHALIWVFHLGVAETLFATRQTERALKEYQWVIDKGPNVVAKAQSALRMGDLFSDRFQYEQALAAYSQALTYFGGNARDFPSIYLNRAEAMYQLGQFDRAKQAFAEFLDHYPTYPAGWRAGFRLGEIYGRGVVQGEDATEASRKWLYYTVNRYPFSPGATLARIRLIPCGDHGGLSWEAQERFFTSEAKTFAFNTEVYMPNFDDYRALSHVRAVLNLKDKEDKTVDVGLEELKTAKNPLVKAEIGLIINEAFRKRIIDVLAAGKKYDALAFYQAKSSLMPRDETGIEPEHLLKLSEAASDLGLGTVAHDISEAYEKGMKSLNRSVASATPDEGDLDGELKISEAKFTGAKALFIASGKKESKKIRESLEGVRPESRFSYEKELILGLLDQAEEKPASALAHARQAVLLCPDHKPDVRLDYWLGTLLVADGNPAAAMETYHNLEKRLGIKNGAANKTAEARTPARVGSEDATAVLGLPQSPSVEELILLQGEILEKLGHWGEAAATYARAVDNGLGGNQARYEWARALIKTGSRESSKKGTAMLETLAAIKSGSSDFWVRLAQETLANQKSEQTAKEGSNR